MSEMSRKPSILSVSEQELLSALCASIGPLSEWASFCLHPLLKNVQGVSKRISQTFPKIRKRTCQFFWAKKGIPGMPIRIDFIYSLLVYMCTYF